MFKFIMIAILMSHLLLCSRSKKVTDEALIIQKTTDFTINGMGNASEWEKANWLVISPLRDSTETRRTMLKVLYSDSGLYFLFYCHDHLLSATITSDFENLWEEDVVEVFLWPAEHFPAYFEYELSPLNYELPLIIPNDNGYFWGWLPWHYEGKRRVIHQTVIIGGKKSSGAAIEAWIAEFFIPYDLIKPLVKSTPSSGSKWRGNFYRCDYDDNVSVCWAWQPVEKRFHEYEKFGMLVFE
jgi:hypothetical protein